MVNLPIFVFYGGQWSHNNCYGNHKVAETLVDDMINFNDLVGLIFEEIQLDASIDLLVLLDIGKTNIQDVFQKKMLVVSWTLTLAKDASTRHLIAHISHHFLEISCSAIGSGGGDSFLVRV